MSRDDLALDEARRIALAAQGFARLRPSGRVDARHLRRTIRQLGLLQIDYINVLLPAQYLVPFSRLGAYDTELLDDLVYRRREFTEQWAHEASLVPMEDWPLLRHRMEASDRRSRAHAAFLELHRDYVKRALSEVRRRGPLTAAELPAPEGEERRNRDWWGWTVPKTALELHFARGRLAVADRRRGDFARAYDLTERVVPAEHRRRRISRDPAQQALLLQAARAQGLGTANDLADYYRIPMREARPQLHALVAAERLHTVSVQGWREPAYLHPDAARPRRIEASALLAPFDPVLWHKPRVQRLFDFDFGLEIWVPRAQRRWGYYVLPFLLGDRLVARVDLKAERTEHRLLVNAAHIEACARSDEVAPALAKELRTLATWLGLDTVRVGRRGKLAGALAVALRH